MHDSRSTVLGFLRQQGLAREGEHAELIPLTGGVSSDLWKVELPGRTLCVKSARERLAVEYDWHAPVSRNRVEYDWLRFAGELCPGQVPRVFGYDGRAGLFAMEYLPPQDYPVWKTQLLAGDVDVVAAQQVGSLVGRLHAAGAADPDAARKFATDANFDALRLEPYLRVTAQAHPDLRDRFAVLTEQTANTHYTVVHGDVSPKNILLGRSGPVLIDAECAWHGDPAFDVAFCLNHLLLKALALPHHRTALRESALALLNSHAGQVNWEPIEEFGARVAALLPALALARVDGASPVEYLDAEQRGWVRALARPLVRTPPPDVATLVERWIAAAGAGYGEDYPRSGLPAASPIAGTAPESKDFQ
ncbi:phosphotransferase [Nocardia sp. NEAU-G5]|uniref:Phosphotransferase n=2 Tax=Nocardia albiluteola TaxID=2842303 RepID=A0ABS6AZ89_9NOCA|nr:phosphotransferase [Nocardia albiluteola]